MSPSCSCFGCRPNKREATYLQKQVHPHSWNMNFCSIIPEMGEFGKGVGRFFGALQPNPMVETIG